MRLLMLYGVNCTKNIWDGIAPYFENYDIDFVEYPHDVTMKATCVNDLTEWVYKNYGHNTYDAVIGHSLGGIIALQLASLHNIKFDKIIYLDTNLKPANEFYRNLMTPEHMQTYKDIVIPMLQSERQYYTPELFDSIQGEFDYTDLLDNIDQKVYAIYGNRNKPDYPNKITDLNLSDKILTKLDIRFVENSCHMMMVENPKQLSLVVKEILSE